MIWPLGGARMSEVQVIVAAVIFLLTAAVAAGESIQHTLRRDLDVQAAPARADLGDARWFDNDRFLRRLAANQLGFVFPAFLVSVGLTLGGALALRISGQSVAACCPSAPAWTGFVLGASGLSGALCFGLSSASRWSQRRTAARLRALAATLPAQGTLMWMSLFTVVRTTGAPFPLAPSAAAVSIPYAALWRSRPALSIHRPAPPDQTHDPAVCVELKDWYDGSRKDAWHWSEPESVVVFGRPAPGQWIVICRPNGEALWPEGRAGTSSAWRNVYKKSYRESQKRLRRTLG